MIAVISISKHCLDQRLFNQPLGSVRHNVKTVDVKPSSPEGSALVLVTGTLIVRRFLCTITAPHAFYPCKIADSTHEMPFSEVFHIFPDAAGGGFFMYAY